MNKHFLPALVLCAAALAACGKSAPLPAQRPPKPVVAVSAEVRDVPRYLDEIGRCVAFQTVLIRPQVSGPITSIAFTDGAELKKGDLLFTIDPRPYQAVLDRAKATLAQDQAKAAYDLSQLQRNQKLSDRQVSSAQDLDSAKSAEKSSQATLLADAASITAAQINLDYCTIRSPIDGRAGKRVVDIGNIVDSSTPSLLQIQRQDPIYAEFTIPESSLACVRKFLASGNPDVMISFPEHPEINRVGKLDFLDSGVRPDSGTVVLRANIPNADRLFWPGQFVNVRLLLETIKDAVLVPSEAVQIGGAGPFLFVVKPDDTVEMRAVKVGQRQGDLVVVSEGVRAGEMVVVTGQLGISPGAPVKIVPSPVAP